MKNSKEILSSLLLTTQMGQVGIRSVLDVGMRPGLRRTLESQLREYNSIESEAHAIASQRGWELKNLEPAVRFMTDRMNRMKLTGRDTDSRIADMMIRGNTKGMIRSLKDQHRFAGQDQQIHILNQKLLDCETAGILKLKTFL